MALSRFKLNFTKNWENPSDFPTYQNNETQVRADLQYLFNEIRTAFNNFLSGAKAVDLPFEKTSSIDATNVQAAIENVQGQVAAFIDDPESVVLPDGSIATSKYQDESVTASKLDVDPTHDDPILPSTIGAAPVAHDHDDRYYTEAEITAMLETDIQPNTAILTNMEGDLADNDLFPLRDQSEATSMRMTWSYLKAQMKAYMDGLYTAISTFNNHHARHEVGGADQITVDTGNIATGAVKTNQIDGGAVTAPKLAEGVIGVAKTSNAKITAGGTWSGSAGKWYQNITITGLLSTDVPIVDMNATTGNATTAGKEIDAWAEIYKVECPSNNTLRVWAVNKPEQDVNIVVVCVRNLKAL